MTLLFNKNSISSQNKVDAKGLLSDFDLKILWTSRTITEIDLSCEAKLLRLEQSPIHADLKAPLREAILSRHRARREPYVALLERLRGQQHPHAAASGRQPPQIRS